jgi:hypothetical protein
LIIPLGVAVANWIRNTVMLVVLAIWSIYIIVTLARRGDVDAPVWGVVPAAYFALNPTWKKDKDGTS